MENEEKEPSIFEMEERPAEFGSGPLASAPDAEEDDEDAAEEADEDDRLEEDVDLDA